MHLLDEPPKSRMHTDDIRRWSGGKLPKVLLTHGQDRHKHTGVLERKEQGLDRPTRVIELRVGAREKEALEIGHESTHDLEAIRYSDLKYTELIKYTEL